MRKFFETKNIVRVGYKVIHSESFQNLSMASSIARPALYCSLVLSILQCQVELLVDCRGQDFV
jgi:hypothetical protein